MNALPSTASTDLSQPYLVTAPGGQTKLLVMDRGEALPTGFALMASNVAHKVALRISGGCKGMGLSDKVAMLDFFRLGFRGYRGMIWSGCTRLTSPDGQLDPMVTDVPGVIAAENACVALGSAPRTDIMRLVDQSRLVLDGYGTAPNPSMSGILFVQNGAEGKSDWDGDLDVAYSLMDNLLDYAGFSGVGVVAWNGGPITVDEIMRSATRGWPTIVIKGSGRGSDEIAAKFEAGDADLMGKLGKKHKLVIVNREDPASFRDALITFGFVH